MPQKNRLVNIENLARVEGEGALYIKYDGESVIDVNLKIFEPPRFFEAFLKGRHYCEAPDITARICGICPVAYQMSAVHAMENALNVVVPDPIKRLRDLLYCGEWIESHVLHMFMLHLPDYLGCHSALEIAKDKPDVVKKALEMKKQGNRIIQLLGGREIHPINVKVGGFYKIPDKKYFTIMLPDLKQATDIAEEMVHLLADLSIPEYTRETIFVSLQDPVEYPMNMGAVTCSNGDTVDIESYDDYFEEYQAQYSHALQSRIKHNGQAYVVGPMARYYLNHQNMSTRAKQAATAVDFNLQKCFNPYNSIIVRALEVLHAFETAVTIIENMQLPDFPCMPVSAETATGYAATEAPRGLLYHRYSINREGLITDSKIVPPTSQNQRSIELDLIDYVPKLADLNDDELTRRCEQAVRNYDPCISCATHFLNLKRLT